MRVVLLLAVLALAVAILRRQPGRSRRRQSKRTSLYTYGKILVTNGFVRVSHSRQGRPFVAVGTNAAETPDRPQDDSLNLTAGGATGSHQCLHFYSIGEPAADRCFLKPKQDILDAVAAAVKKVRPGRGDRREAGTSCSDPAGIPTAAELDAVSGDVPVALSRVDSHAVWVNSRSCSWRASPMPRLARAAARSCATAATRPACLLMPPWI